MSEHVQRIRYLRERSKETQESIARSLKISRTAISKYECGKREPDIYTIKALASYFKVSVDYLLGVSDIESENCIYEKQAYIKEEEQITNDTHLIIQDKALMNLVAKIRENKLDIEAIDNILNTLIFLKKRR